jgi:putative ABC transport system permease protein
VRAILDGVRLALRAIGRNPLRASLTVLGILIGVAAVVVVTALAAGARRSIARSIQSIGSNFIIIFPQSKARSGAHGALGTGTRLTEGDAAAILRESTSVVAICPTLRTLVQIVHGDQNWNTNAVGTTLSYFEIRDWKVARGALWDARDEALASKVIVIGSSVASNLFGSDDPVGRMVRIGRYPYRILGVLETKGEAPFGGDQDDVVIMPISSYRSRVQHTSPGFAGVLMASASAPETTDRAVRQIDGILRQRHRIADGDEPDFEIHTQKEFAEMQASVTGILQWLLIGVAAVSLAVGGIGVMNIMLVSVTERTREIGIRMAIGAREADIRTQFLVEAVALAMLGGLAGALLGAGVIGALGKLLPWPMGLSPQALSISVGVSAAIGIGFGFFPAHRAARLDPIEALRHE